MRSHDPEEAIRHDVIVTIINAGKKDLNLVNDQLLGFVRERTLDKRVRQMCRHISCISIADTLFFFSVEVEDVSIDLAFMFELLLSFTHISIATTIILC